MNGNCSTTGCKNSERLPDTDRLEQQWKTIDWKKAETEVSRLQAKIAKATQEKKWNTVKRLQYLLTHSYAVASVKKVSETDTSGTAATSGNQITLYTCVRDQSAYRWYVVAQEI